jgi:hypothetical protein
MKKPGVAGIIVGAAISCITLVLCIVFSYRQRLYITFWIFKTRR